MLAVRPQIHGLIIYIDYIEKGVSRRAYFNLIDSTYK